MSKKKNTTQFDVMPVVQSIFLMFGYLGILVVGRVLLKEEFTEVIKWWFALVMLGVSCLPLTNLLFSGFHDGGFMFSKAIGLAVSGWFLWALSSMHILKFTRTNTIIVVVLVFVINLVFWYLSREVKHIEDWKARVTVKSENDATKKVVLALTFELVFLAIFIIGCYVKCFKPEAYGTEKFMDYGFMTSMMRSDYMPPEDFWASGTNLNYYYMGQYMSTFMVKFSGVTVNSGYNLGLMMLMAFCFILSYSIVYEVMRLTVTLRNEKKRVEIRNGNENVVETGRGFTAVVCHAAGALAGTAVTFAGNMHYTIFCKIIPAVQNMLGMEVDSYWFPDATRYIGYNPETDDKTIHEFPSYSFVLGDLHAHVTNIMFVLTVLGILYAWLLYRKERMDAVKTGAKIEPYSRLLEVFHPSIIMVGFFIGLFQITNYWDFPIYFVVAGAVILFSNAVIHKFEKETLILTALHAAVVLGMGVIVSFLFNLKFDSMAKGIALCTDHTPLYQLAVLWGLPVTVLVCYLVSTICKKKKEEPYQRKKGSKLLLFQFIDRLSLPELFIITIGLCAAGLVLMPELIYVVDIYGGHKRANTMFKFTYQAFIMFGLMMGYVITKFILLAKNGKQIVCGVLTGFLLLGTVGYLGKSVESWFGDIKDQSRFQGLDAAAFVNKENIYDAGAVDWINENIEGRPVMLEAHGNSYTYANRISTLTGLPTILGWHTHEWLWKDDYTWVEARKADVQTIYTSADVNVVKELLNTYEVSYIYVGDEEHNAYAVNDALLQTLGEIVFRNDGAYIVKVK